MKARWVVWALMFLALAAGVRGLEAQACLGNGARSGQGYLTGEASFTDGAWALGGDLGVNARGPVSAEASFTHTMIDNSDVAVSAVGGTLAADFGSGGLSVCPLAFGGYQWLSNKGELSEFDVGADGIFVGGGLGLGGRLEGETGLAFLPAVAALVVHDRATVSVGDLSVTGTDTYGSFVGGFLVGKGHVYPGASVSITTQDEADPVFSVGLNIAF